MTQNVRQNIAEMTKQALARCDALGITHADFYQAIQDEQRLHPPSQTSGGYTGVADLFERAVRRLKSMSN